MDYVKDCKEAFKIYYDECVLKDDPVLTNLCNKYLKTLENKCKLKGSRELTFAFTQFDKLQTIDIHSEICSSK
jgi:hypothetical protein